jgi:hypothetical protein
MRVAASLAVLALALAPALGTASGPDALNAASGLGSYSHTSASGTFSCPLAALGLSEGLQGRMLTFRAGGASTVPQAPTPALPPVPQPPAAPEAPEVPPLEPGEPAPQSHGGPLAFIHLEGFQPQPPTLGPLDAGEAESMCAMGTTVSWEATHFTGSPETGYSAWRQVFHSERAGTTTEWLETGPLTQLPVHVTFQAQTIGGPAPSAWFAEGDLTEVVRA